jgi:polygalacturonase
MRQPLTVACILAAAAASAVVSGGGGGIFNVVHFGAKGDGVTDSTSAVRRAAAALAAAGGGELLFPPGATVLTAPFNLSSHSVLTIGLNATVLCSARGEDYGLVQVLPWLPFSSAAAPGYWPQSCVYFDGGAEGRYADGGRNVTIQGPGTIDGQGQGWWKCGLDRQRPLLTSPCLTSPPYDARLVANRSNTRGGGRPHLIIVRNASNVVMRHLRTRNTPNWNIHFAWVTNLHVHHVHSTNDPGGPNADGLDIDCVQGALVEDNYFDVDDDALCVKSGRDWDGRHFGRPARDILFRNNVIGRGHGITVGSETSGGVYNVTFDNITMANTGTGIRMKSQRGRGGLVSDITYKNIHMVEIAGQCVQVTLNYHAGLNATNKTGTPVFRNILLENVRCDKGKTSFWIDGLAEQVIENLTLVWRPLRPFWRPL